MVFIRFRIGEMMVSKKIFLLTISLIVFILFLSGCEEKSNNIVNKNKIFIIDNHDDGFVARDNALMTGVIILENNQPMRVGLYSSSEYSSTQLNLICRGILRFDKSKWDNSDITFFIKCTKVQGIPNRLEAYFIDDPGSIQEVTQAQDILSVWSLTDSSARFFGEAVPVENEWVQITVQADVVNTIIDQKYSKNEYMTIMLKLFMDDFTDNYDNYYEFATIDYTPSDESDQPYIQLVD